MEVIEYLPVLLIRNRQCLHFCKIVLNWNTTLYIGAITGYRECRYLKEHEDFKCKVLEPMLVDLVQFDMEQSSLLQELQVTDNLAQAEHENARLLGIGIVKVAIRPDLGSFRKAPNMVSQSPYHDHERPCVGQKVGPKIAFESF